MPRHADLKKRARVALRVNPDIDAKTHPHISTGLKSNKFGVAYADTLALCRVASTRPALELVGLGCHIGSQITEIAPYVEAADRILDLVDSLEREKISLSHIDLGGGLGIRYQNESPPQVSELIEALLSRLDARGHRNKKVIFEPGRSIVGNAGVLLTRVEYLKPGESKNFAIVDAAMNDLIRPAMYDAWMNVLPVVPRKQWRQEVRRRRPGVRIRGLACARSRPGIALGRFARDRERWRLRNGNELQLQQQRTSRRGDGRRRSIVLCAAARNDRTIVRDRVALALTLLGSVLQSQPLNEVRHRANLAIGEFRSDLLHRGVIATRALTKILQRRFDILSVLRRESRILAREYQVPRGCGNPNTPATIFRAIRRARFAAQDPTFVCYALYSTAPSGPQTTPIRCACRRRTAAKQSRS